MNIPNHVVEQAKQADLLALAERRVSLRRESSREFSGPCPRFGIGGCTADNDGFHVTSEWFFCRTCHPKRGDAIEFIRWLDGSSFPVAVSTLTGWSLDSKPAPAPAPVQSRQPVPPKRTAQSPQWIAKATRIVDVAHEELCGNSSHAEQGQAYLDKRGIESHCWIKYRLGFAMAGLPGSWDENQRNFVYPKQPAIVMPWYRQEQIWAVRFRFLQHHKYTDVNGKAREEKQSALYESFFEGGLYGGHALLGSFAKEENSTGNRIENYRTLVLCEGEINAISIWQTCEPWNWDVLSMGSESQKLSQAALEYAKCFERVLIWMDRAEVAKSLMALIPGAYGINSLPVLDGTGKPVMGANGKPKTKDANDLLCEGLLGGFLATARLRSCQSKTERDRLKWALWDADNRFISLLDAGAKQVLAGMLP